MELSISWSFENQTGMAASREALILRMNQCFPKASAGFDCF